MTHTPPAAVLWDLDGTLVDTEPYWLSGESALVTSWGGEWSREDGLTLVGAGLWHSARVLQGRGVQLGEAQIIDDLTDRVMEQFVEIGVPWRPGALDLLAEIRSAGIPTALVTMSIGRMANYVASRVGFEGFDFVISGDDVTHSKPHPEPYLRAAELLGVAPAACVAIEDSEPGIASASAAGMVVIGVPFMGEISESTEFTEWPTLDGRSLADVSAVFSTVHTG
ncbi:MAG: HAD family phosphatase [Salinibacterium sp.]|nr:MAG: HAD family phosphatase [Salinibacterium sp.]